MWHPDQYLKQLYEQSEQRRQRQAAEISDHSLSLRGKLDEGIGSFPGFDAPLEPQLLEREETEDLIRERVEYTTAEGLRVPAYVLIPKSVQAKGEKRPGVLAWHGHGYGSREVVGLLKDGTPDPSPASGGHRHFGLQLAKKGMVVLAPDLVGLGDRQPSKKAKNSCFHVGTTLLMHGKTIGGLRVREAMKAADYLAGREEVDARRLGCMGFSGGGMVAAFSAALDERTKAAVICGYSNTFKGSIMDRNHCIDNYVPGILQYAEMPDILGLVAPRALFIESGEGDPLFPAPHVREAVAQIKAKYERIGGLDRFASDIFEGNHEVSGTHSLNWMAGMLQAGGV